MKMTHRKRPRWFFYPAWVALSTISIPIAWATAWALVSQVEKVVGGTIQVGGTTRITEDFLTSYILLPMLGLLTGFLQYLLLRRHLPRMLWWVAATTLGLLLGLLGGRVVPRTLYKALDPVWSGMLMTISAGGCMGLAQWLVLRRRVRHAAWWIPANVLGWGVVGWGAASLSSQMLIPVVGIVLVPGIATSIALWFLLDQSPLREGSGRNSPPNSALELTT
jgi:hypothetical protein